jgi:hypothetical protein
MSSNISRSNGYNDRNGLPPVKPPSGRFILQLFLIPGLIVLGLVLVLAFGGLIWVSSSSPESFLARLDNPNPDIRWRAAHELSQVLKRPESLELASNPEFALDLAERLQTALAALEQAELAAKKEFDQTFQKIENDKTLTANEKADRQDRAALAAWRKLAPDRDYVLFLTSSLGEFTIPVGVHVLSTVAMKDKSPDIKGLSLRRVRAVQALADLGDNMQRLYFGKIVTPQTKVLTAVQKNSIIEKLAEAASGSSDRARMAQYAHDVLLQKRPADVDVVLEYCAKSDNIYLREWVALALSFWDGDRVEPTLSMLAKDNGHGKWIRVNDAD